MLNYVILLTALWDVPNWTKDVPVSRPRTNIYEVDTETFTAFNREGRLHALWYPVDVTGLKIPYKPIEIVSKVSDPDFLYAYMGLKKYPDSEGEGAYFVPFKDGTRPEFRMGITKKDGYVTASCTACHAESLFGKPVIGLTNKTPRANDTFYRAHMIVPNFPGALLGLDKNERNLWKKAQQTFKWIGVKKPQVLGLDTSLATVSLSLSKRDRNSYATVSKASYKKPRNDVLETFVADSKPMPWFALKYKNRWLADGSVVSGNPILTNILWNEVGRGVDLKKLEEWVMTPKAQKEIVELTSAVFATTPPRYVEFFGQKSIDVDSAKRGETLFNVSCYKCHGVYKKDWATSTDTTEVLYPELTKVEDVGTDPNRWMAMKDLSVELNRLSFSETFNIKTIPQKGYVPPPLVGIWSRWPYFHNNSAPTLCDVLRPVSERRQSWYVGSPVNPETDFDKDCNGFPVVVPRDWKTKERHFDTTRPGLSNMGHAKVILHPDEVKDVVMFLKTL
jgi:cytochrome c5